MCLGVPGQVLSIEDDAIGMRMGRVSFGGILKDVCLECVPEAQVGDYVVVHVGFAISRVDEGEAERIFRYVEEMGELAELEADDASSPREPGS